MPLLHCNECHHEWEGQAEDKCDWCGSKSYILEATTSLEQLVEKVLPSSAEKAE